MAPRKRESRVFDDEVDSVEDAPRLKKARVAKTATSKSGKPKSNAGNTSSKSADKEGNPYWELTASGTRRVTVSNFQGKRMVQIREYYENKETGEKLPGKKGIALPIDQFTAFLSILPEIEQELSAAGISVPRPNYSKDLTKEAEEGDGDDSAEDNQEVGGSKMNFEATSDEEEDD